MELVETQNEEDNFITNIQGAKKISSLTCLYIQ